MQYFVESLKPSRMWHSKHLRWFFGVSYFLKQLQQGIFYLRIKQLGRILAYLKQLGCIFDVDMVTGKEKKNNPNCLLLHFSKTRLKKNMIKVNKINFELHEC